MQYRTLQNASLAGQRVILRAGFDVPIQDGVVQDATRIEAMVPTMKHILDSGASLILLAHQGRPKAERVPDMSQQPLVPVLEKLLGRPVQFADVCVGSETQALADALTPGDVLLLENVRYEAGEKTGDPAFADALAALGDVYVCDAFTNAHRSHTSMTLLAERLPSFMGLNMQKEVENLSRVLENPESPVTLIVSGAKMETKVPVIENFLPKGSHILIGGCIANAFIASQGFAMGTSRYEEEWMEKAGEIAAMSHAEDKATIHIPTDVKVAASPDENAEVHNVSTNAIADGMAIFDLGDETVQHYQNIIRNSRTVVWCGPLGFYEVRPFAESSIAIAGAVQEVAKTGAFTVIGGGDTLDVHARYGLSMDDYGFASTAGGAMLDFLSGKQLPALVPLRDVTG